MTDFTLKLSVDVLAGLGADFDGDQVTLVSVKNPLFKKMFMQMCPTYHAIDRADGRCAYNFAKDYAAILSAAWEMDSALDSYLRDPDSDSTDLIHALGLDEGMNDDRTLALRKLLESSATKGSFKDRMIDPFPQWSEN